MDATQQRIAAALKCTADTRFLRLGRRTLAEVGQVFETAFGARPALVIADRNTFAAAGRGVLDALARTGIQAVEPFVFEQPDLHAYFEHVETIERQLTGNDAIPVAVGSGTINDLTKLASHRCGRRYMAVATAASMDGYPAYGASITQHGSKQTFTCPAPLAVVADLDVICAAPGELNAAGYGDLIAKIAAGADWICADALGCEPIDRQAWAMVQEPLRSWIDNPDAIRKGEFSAVTGLTEGLLMTGFAMQYCKSSRPASGADHQFSHLWDMQHHQHNGRVPYHGYKVAIGTIASTLLYEELMRRPIDRLDVAAACEVWPDGACVERDVASMHELPDLRATALQEMKAKHLTHDQLAERLEALKAIWPELTLRLKEQLIPSGELCDMLRAAGAPHRPEDIGIDLPRLRRSYIQAWQIRRRFTVLDVAAQSGLMNDCLQSLFSPNGAWTRISQA